MSRSEDTGKIARSAGKVSVAVMCSRVLGLVREQVMAAYFGAGTAYDAFVVAFRIPNLLRDLFGEGALSSAFVAVFTEHDANKGEEATWRLASNVITAISLLLSAITLAGIVWSEPLVRLIAPDFAQVPDKVALTAHLTAIMFPFLLFVSLAAVVMGMLNAKGRFFMPAMASSFFNLGSILGGIGCAVLLDRLGRPPIVGMAIGTLIGGLLQLGCQVPALLRCGFRLTPRLDLADPGLRRIFRLMLPAIIGLGATQINIFVNTNFAASCAEGSVSWLNYAFRLVQFPIGVFGVALSIATMPVVSRHAANRDLDRLKSTYVSSLVMACGLSIPATVGLAFLAGPIIRIIFEHGAFTAGDTARTAEALVYYVVGLFAYAAVKITVPVFYALDDTRYPVIGSFLAVAGNVLIILASVGQLQHKAIALSTSCAMILNFLFLSAVLYRKVGGYPLRPLGAGLVKVMAASAAMGCWLFGASRLLGEWMRGGMGQDLTGLSAIIASAAVVYWVVLYRAGLPELDFLVERLKSRFAPGQLPGGDQKGQP